MKVIISGVLVLLSICNAYASDRDASFSLCKDMFFKDIHKKSYNYYKLYSEKNEGNEGNSTWVFILAPLYHDTVTFSDTLLPELIECKVINKKVVLFEKKEINKLNIQDSEGKTALMRAVKSSDDEKVASLIKEGADVTIRPFLGKYHGGGIYSILEMVSNDKLDSIGNMLLKAGVDINEVLPNATPLLFNSITNRDNIRLEWLLKHGANVSVTNINGDSPLMQAIHTGSFDETIELLLKYGANVNVVNKDGNTPLMLVIKTGSYNEKTLELLAEYGADPYQTNKTGESVAGMVKNDVYMFDILYKAGLKVDINPNVLMKYAVFSKNDTLIDEALDKGANPNVAGDEEGMVSLLSISLIKEKNQLAQKLILKGADVDFYVNETVKPYLSNLILGIMYVGISNNTLELIIDKTKEINQVLLISRMEIGYTALDMAVAKGNKELVKLIKKRGGLSAKVEVPDYTLVTNIELAKQHAKNFIELLAEKKCKQAFNMTNGGIWSKNHHVSEKQEWLKYCPKMLPNVSGMKVVEVYYPKDSYRLISYLNLGAYKGLNLENTILFDIETVGLGSTKHPVSLILSCSSSQCSVEGIEFRAMKLKVNKEKEAQRTKFISNLLGNYRFPGLGEY